MGGVWTCALALLCLMWVMSFQAGVQAEQNRTTPLYCTVLKRYLIYRRKINFFGRNRLTRTWVTNRILNKCAPEDDKCCGGSRGCCNSKDFASVWVALGVILGVCAVVGIAVGGGLFWYKKRKRARRAAQGNNLIAYQPYGGGPVYPQQAPGPPPMAQYPAYPGPPPGYPMPPPGPPPGPGNTPWYPPPAPGFQGPPPPGFQGPPPPGFQVPSPPDAPSPAGYPASPPYGAGGYPQPSPFPMQPSSQAAQ